MPETCNKILDRIRGGARLSSTEAIELYSNPRLLDIAILANHQNKKMNGKIVGYNHHKYLSTVYIDFIGGKEDYPPKEISYYVAKRADKLDLAETTEIRLGSVHPGRISFKELIDILKIISEKFPSKKIRALSAFELHAFKVNEGLSIEKMAKELTNAASLYLDGRSVTKVREIKPRFGMKKGLLDEKEWLSIHRICHLNGLRSDSTMEYGKDDTLESRIEYMEKLRDLQDETKGFLSFIPLAYQYQEKNTGLYRKTSGIDDLKTIAISRLYLDNFDQIRVQWGRVGLDISQLALIFGANNFEGELSSEKNNHLSADKTFRSLNRNELSNIIKKTNRVPVEKDGDFYPIDQKNSLVSQDFREEKHFYDPLLYKMENRVSLSLEDYENVAQNISLLKIGSLAFDMKKNHHDSKILSHQVKATEIFTPSLSEPDSLFNETMFQISESNKSECKYISIDLGGWKNLEKISFKNLTNFIEKLNMAFEKIQITLKGIKGIWYLGRNSKYSVSEIAKTFHSLGVTMVESSENESESDLTRSEKIDFHKSMQQCGIPTIAKIEISAPYSGEDQPFWEDFIKDVVSYKKLNDETELLIGLKIQRSKYAFISPYEYLRAISLSRIICFNIANIITPFDKIPTINQTRARIQVSKNREVLKLIPLCAYFGANDIGFPNPLSRNAQFVAEEIQNSFLKSVVRDLEYQSI